MGVMRRISDYFKQFAGEVSGNPALYEEGRHGAGEGHRNEDGQAVPMEPRIVPGTDSVVSEGAVREEAVHADATPRFAMSQAGRSNDGISSIAGSDDVTASRLPPRSIAGTDDAAASRIPPGMASPARHQSADFDGNAPQGGETPVADYSDIEQLKLYRLVPIAAPTDTNWNLAPNQGEVVVRARSSGDARVVAADAELDFMEIDALPGDGNSTTSSSAFRNEKLYTVVVETDPAYPVDGPREVVAGTVRVDNIRPTEL